MRCAVLHAALASRTSAGGSAPLLLLLRRDWWLHRPHSTSEPLWKNLSFRLGTQNNGGRTSDSLRARPALAFEQVGLVLRRGYTFHQRFDSDRKSTRLNSSHGYISYAL